MLGGSRAPPPELLEAQTHPRSSHTPMASPKWGPCYPWGWETKDNHSKLDLGTQFQRHRAGSGPRKPGFNNG